MAELIWSPAALRDLEAIADYIAKDSTERAKLVVNRIFAATQQLVSFPQSGRVIPEIEHPDCREIFYSVYRIMYRIENNAVWITGIVHGARDWRP
jgi:plasmid stabilization system protein ParE